MSATQSEPEPEAESADQSAEAEKAAEAAAGKKAAEERAAQEKAAQEKAAREEAAAKKAAEEKAARERAAEEKAAREKAAEEKAAREKAAQEKAAAEDRTSVMAFPPKPVTPQPGQAEEKTTFLSPPPPRAPVEDRTTLLSGPGADDDRTSVVSMPPRRRIVTSSPEPPTSVVGDVPGFNRPNRPAWTPMQMRPQERRGGVTIFGTTLTRRQAAIGLGIVLTFVILIGIIVVQAFGSDSEDNQVTQGGVASAPAQPSAGTGGSTPSKETPTSKPPSSPAAAAIPDDWRTLNYSGFSFKAPPSASGSGGGNNITYSWGKGRQFRFDVVPGKIDPVKYLRSDLGSATEVDFNGRKAAEHEYERNPSGYKQRVVRRVFNDGNQTIVLTWYTEAKDWNAGKKDLAAVYQSFKFR